MSLRGSTPWIFGAALVVPLTNVTVVFAQQTVPSPDQGAPATGSTDTTAGAPAPGAPGAPTTSTTVTTSRTPYGVVGNPVSPNGTIGGGNATESSAHPVTGDQEDSFDIKGENGASSAYGDPNGPIFMGRGGGFTGGGQVPFDHIVRKGDTLSGICDIYFHNPYQWPRIWSFNPQIQNPNWIYPGDMVRLRPGGGLSSAGTPSSSSSNILGDTHQRVPATSVFLRDTGYIEDSDDQDWGEITGAPEDRMFLAPGDDAYIHIGGTRNVHVGEELTIFQPVRRTDTGNVIEILGSIRVNQWNPDTRIAGGTVTEALDAIERGARVGPVGRRFEVVPPVRNARDATAHVVASIHPTGFFGQNQIVFIDHGQDKGLVPGNRLFIIRQGDAWRRSLATPGAGYRISPESENMPDMEMTPGTRDESRYPEEVIGELRVLESRPHSATCLVTQSKLEIEHGDTAVARRGY